MRKQRSKKPALALQTRQFLIKLAKAQLPTQKSKEKVAKHFKTTSNTIDSMLYRGEGGLDSWVELITYLYQVDAKQLEDLFLAVKWNLKKQHSALSKADLVWEQTATLLNDDKKHFWANIIQAVEGFDPAFSIKQMKKKQS